MDNEMEPVHDAVNSALCTCFFWHLAESWAQPVD